MKKLISLFLLLMCFSATFAFDTSSNFGINKQSSIDAYQQYVGKSFFVRPAYGNLEKDPGFKYNKSYDGKTFTITKITAKDVVIANKPNREVVVAAVEDGGKAKFNFTAYENVALKGLKMLPLIGYIPIVFIEPLNEFKQKNIGETITHEMVKDQYEIVDAYVGEYVTSHSSFASPMFTVKNKRTGETISCPYKKVKEAPFAYALQGSYKTSLVKVEKPEDATNRYGETKTIQDDGIDKYSYNDSIIDITIFGTNEEFNFVLKNISTHSLKIIWNEAAFVGLDGSTSKIMHVGTKFSERESDQPATVIIKNAKIDDIAKPTANVYYDEGVRIGYSTIGNGWKTKSMFPEDYVGKEPGEIRLMLPIQVKDVVNEYTFVFKVSYTYDHPELLNVDKL